MPWSKITTKLIQLFVLIASLSVHEYAHARSAYKLGDTTAAEAGRMTLNPLAHIEPLGFLMMLVAPVGWAKPVPVNPYRYRPDVSMQKGNVIVSVSGPLSNLLISCIVYFLLTILSFVSIPQSAGGLNAFRTAILLLQLFYWLNLNLAVFNLLPIPPLDGFNLIGQFLPQKAYNFLTKNSRWFFLAIVVSAFVAPQIIGNVLSVLRIPLSFVVEIPGKLLRLILAHFM